MSLENKFVLKIKCGIFKFLKKEKNPTCTYSQ